MIRYRNRIRKINYGLGGALFKDYDRDGVPNVFDCRPFNKKKQDVIFSSRYGGVRDMYTRQEQGRLNSLYQRQYEEILRQQREAQRTQDLAYQQYLREQEAAYKKQLEIQNRAAQNPSMVTTAQGDSYVYNPTRDEYRFVARPEKVTITVKAPQRVTVPSQPTPFISAPKVNVPKQTKTPTFTAPSKTPSKASTFLGTVKNIFSKKSSSSKGSY